MSQDETAVNDQVVAQEPTTTESAPVETKAPEVADPLLDALSSDDDDSVEPKTEPEAKPEEPKEEPAEPSEEPPVEEQPLGEDKPLTPKSENRFQQLANENKYLRETIEQLNAQVYQPQTADELMDEGLSPELAEVRSLKQQLELQNYNNRVVEAQTYLNQEAGEVIKNYPIFDPDSPDYQEDLAESARAALRSSLQIDPNTGQVVGSHLTPLQIYKPIADAYEKSRVKGQIQGQKNTEKMLSSVDPQASVTPRQPKKDPLLEILSSDD